MKKNINELNKVSRDMIIYNIKNCESRVLMIKRS